MLEVIATCIDDVRKITEGSGQRIELVSALTEGGVTPSAALIKRAVRCAGSIPVMVMIRPHAQSFVYAGEDLEIMREDLETALDCGAAGVVLGALTVKDELDRHALDFLLSVNLRGKSVTFHRALDRSADPALTFEQLLDYPVDRVLTSGGPGNITGNLELLKHFVTAGKSARPDKKIKVMAGGGVNLNNVCAIMQATGIEEIHVGTAVRRSGSCIEPIEPLLVGQFYSLCAVAEDN